MPAAKLLLLPRFGLRSRPGFLHGVQTARLTLDQDRNDDLLVRPRLETAPRESPVAMSSFLADLEIKFLKKDTQTPRLTRRLPGTSIAAAPIEQTPVPMDATLRTSSLTQWYHLLATQIFYQPPSRHNLRNIAVVCW